MMDHDTWFISQSELADRWLVDPAYEEGKHVVDCRDKDRNWVVEKIKQLTTGNFFYKSGWIQFEKEEDFVAFRLAV